MTNPAYTVVIPAHNAARTLADAIDSVLNQTVPPVAVVVIDDGSTDDTLKIARGFGAGVRVFTQANAGPAAATDHGFKHVGTPLVAGLDADDIWFPQKAERQMERLVQAPAADIVFCRAVVFNHGTDPAAGSRVQDLWGRSSMLMSTETAYRIGPVAQADHLQHGEMIRWLDRARRLGLKLVMLPEALAGRRIIEGSLSYRRGPAALLPLLAKKVRLERGG